MVNAKTFSLSRLKISALFTVTIIITLIGGLRAYQDVQANEERLLSQKKFIEKQIRYTYESEVIRVRNALLNRGEFVAQSPEIIEAFQKRDRKSLYLLAKKTF